MPAHDARGYKVSFQRRQGQKYQRRHEGVRKRREGHEAINSAASIINAPM